MKFRSPENLAEHVFELTSNARTLLAGTRNYEEKETIKAQLEILTGAADMINELYYKGSQKYLFLVSNPAGIAEPLKQFHDLFDDLTIAWDEEELDYEPITEH